MPKPQQLSFPYEESTVIGPFAHKGRPSPHTEASAGARLPQGDRACPCESISKTLSGSPVSLSIRSMSPLSCQSACSRLLRASKIWSGRTLGRGPGPLSWGCRRRPRLPRRSRRLGRAVRGSCPGFVGLVACPVGVRHHHWIPVGSVGVTTKTCSADSITARTSSGNSSKSATAAPASTNRRLTSEMSAPFRRGRSCPRRAGSGWPCR
jgi:hypothetical protein